MNKFLKWSISIVVCVLILFIISSILYKPNEISVNLMNNTEEPIDGLSIIYTDINSNIKLPAIQPGDEYNLVINIIESSSDQFYEGSMGLIYEDNDLQEYEETIIGYFLKGSHGKVDILINDIDSNGRLSIQSKNTVR